MVRVRLREKRLIFPESDDGSSIMLKDQREIRFAKEPDIAMYRQGRTLCAVEVKGGIDPAGVLERVGAAIKSLRRPKEDSPDATTILLIQAVSMTTQAETDLQTNRQIVNYWFNIEDLVGDEAKREEFFQLFGI